MSLTLLLLLACAGDADDSGDSGPSIPELSVDPDAIDFGLVPYDGVTEAEAGLEIGNRGGGALLLLDFAIVGGEQSPFTLSSVPTTNLLRGERVTLGLTAMALGAGEATDLLRITTNDPEHELLEIPLSMLADGPGVAASPSSVDMGTLELGCSQTERVSISNEGSVELVVNAVQLNGGVGFGLNLLPEENGSLPWTLAPGASLEVALSFDPATAGSDSAELRINSNDPLNDALVIPLQGSAEAGPEQTQSVRLGAEVDVVFVVDLNATTATYREQLVDDLGDLTEALVREDADYRLSAVVAEDGCVLGGDLTLDASLGTSAQQAALEAMLTASPHSLSSRGFALTEAGLSAAQGGCNAGLLREGAATALVLLSAVDDGDTGAVSDAVAALEALVPYPSLLRFNALAGAVPNGCEVASAGVRYERAAELTDGLFSSICDNSYRAAFNTMAQDAAAAALEHVPLDAAPVPSSIIINVRGVDRTDGWTYDAVENALILDASLRVSEGDSLTLRYSPMPESCD
ncbi:MAG: choice-of-anchor D domain-containing protein [Alphaproteobacteria bacterium]|nr:choice-of-anchor D domain-containing protein [Alphaproteobacteria bacterium]MCB9791987.1 choice-of-anchor D domain-containing protein [Alphaproteobacteria bacterium]